jgi:hypothetical protein
MKPPQEPGVIHGVDLGSDGLDLVDDAEVRPLCSREPRGGGDVMRLWSDEIDAMRDEAR